MSFQINEDSLIKQVFYGIPVSQIQLTAKDIPANYLDRFVFFCFFFFGSVFLIFLQCSFIFISFYGWFSSYSISFVMEFSFIKFSFSYYRN